MVYFKELQNDEKTNPDPGFFQVLILYERPGTY